MNRATCLVLIYTGKLSTNPATPWSTTISLSDAFSPLQTFASQENFKYEHFSEYLAFWQAIGLKGLKIVDSPERAKGIRGCRH